MAAECPRLTIPCNSHLGFLAQGRQYDPVKPWISGAIAFSLAQRGLGCTAKFRSCLKAWLRARVAHRIAMPPGPQDPRTLHRDKILALFLPNTTEGDERRIVLQAWLHGDVSSSSIVFFSPHQNPDLDVWAGEVTAALYPRSTPLFPRHRWLRSHATVDSVGLLTNIHNLASHVVPIWVQVFGGKRIEDVVRDDDVDLEPLGDCSVLAIDLRDDEVVEEAAQGPRYNEAGQLDWAAYNEIQRGSTLRFAASNPGPICIIARVALDPAVQGTAGPWVLIRSARTGAAPHVSVFLPLSLSGAHGRSGAVRDHPGSSLWLGR